jgi:hypothetical protein
MLHLLECGSCDCGFCDCGCDDDNCGDDERRKPATMVEQIRTAKPRSQIGCRNVVSAAKEETDREDSKHPPMLITPTSLEPAPPSQGSQP